MITKQCIDCGVSKSFYPSQLVGASARYTVRGGVYRCRTCWNKKRTTMVIRPRVLRVATICVVCGKTRCMTVRERSTYAREYKCRPCYLKDKTERTRYNKQSFNYGKVLVTCPTCNKPRLLNKKYARSVVGMCRNCRDNKARRHAKRTRLVCRVRGTVRLVKRSVAQRSIRSTGECYCRSCGNKHRPTGELSSTWRGGISFEPYSTQWTEQVKTRIRQRDGNCCVLCNIEQSPRRRLSVHHIDYNKFNVQDSNLVALCLSCHTKTNFNREYWRSLLSALLKAKDNVYVRS